MSLNFKKDHIYGLPVTPGVITQINRRKEIVSKRTERTPDDILYLTSNTSWIRVTSSVNIENDGGSTNAKKYQLFKGIASANRGFVPVQDPERSSYSESTEYGYIPIPGITDFQVLTQNELGTLRAATITFIVNSPEDFSKLEQLYLRPGYTLLLEWGHAIKVDNEGEIGTDITYFPLDDFTSNLSIPDIKSKILELREKNSYNYDGMFGLIRNFSWTYNGSNYLCTVDVVSDGEVLESILNTNVGAGSEDDGSEDLGYDSSKFGSDVEKILNTIKVTSTESFFDSENTKNNISELNFKIQIELNKTIPKYQGAFSDLRVMSALFGGKSSTRESYWKKYIRLRDLLNLLNFGSLLYDENNNNVVKFYTDSNNLYPFTTFDSHIGWDPDVCVIPKAGKHPDFHIPFSTQVKDLEETDLLNIFIGVDYILEKYIKFAKYQKLSDNNMYSLVEDILTGIEDNLGGINNFAIAYEDDTNLYHIIDTTVVPSSKDFEIGDNGNPKAYIDLVGLKTEIENLQFNSSITSDFSTIISVAAQRSSDPAALENISNLQRWNQGLVNRHLPELKSGDSKVDENDQSKKFEDQKIKYIKFLEEISYNEYYIAYDYQKFFGYKRIHRHITRQALKNQTIKAETNDPGIIPFFLNFTIKGISGIKILQAFKINEFFLPSSYKGKVAFLINGLDHKFINGRWVTDIKAQLISL